MRDGWELKTLSDVSDVRDGTHDSPKYQEEGYALITSKNLKNGKLTYDKIKYISEEDYTNINKRSKVDIGDILFAMIGTIGNPVIIEKEPNYAIKNVALFKVYDDYDSSFIKYYFDSAYVIEKMQSEAKGTTQKFVGLGYLRKFPIVVPPLPEQKQIVITLDKAFKQIDQAKANLEKNLNNAKELFQSKLNEVFSQKGEGWEEKTLNDTCIVERGSSPRPIKSFITEDEDGVNWIKIGDTKGIEKYIYKTNQKITKKGAEKSRFVDIGDFILSNSMSFGRPYIMKTQGCIHDGWFVFRLPENIDAEFFWYLLVSPNIKEQFQGLASGAIVKNISGDLVKKTILSIPLIKTQKEIVKELDKFSQLSNELQTHYQQKLNNLEELKKSILQKAFKGELCVDK